MTLRDDVWEASLLTLKNRGKFQISDLGFDESERYTVRRVLKEMEDRGFLRRESEYGSIWRIGPTGEMVLDIDEETVQKSKQ